MGPGKSLQLPPPRIHGTSSTTPPPPSKSAGKIAPTTPPRIHGTSSTTPPRRNRPGKSLQLPPPSNSRNFIDYPPPRNRTPLFRTLATALHGNNYDLFYCVMIICNFVCINNRTWLSLILAQRMPKYQK